jgi:hypothetical protein
MLHEFDIDTQFPLSTTSYTTVIGSSQQTTHFLPGPETD